MSDSLWPHGLQYARLPCPSSSPGICSSSCPLSQWSHPIIPPSVVPFCLQSFPASKLFQWVSSFRSDGQGIGDSDPASVLPMNIQDCFQDWLVWFLCCPRDSQESSPIPQFKSISSSVFSFLCGLTLTSIHDYWKNHSFDYADLCWQSDVPINNK